MKFCMLSFLTNDGDLIPLEVFTLFIYPSFSHRFKSWIWFIRDEAGEEENLKVLSRCLMGNPVKTVPKDQCMLVHECNIAFAPSKNSFKECKLQILISNVYKMVKKQHWIISLLNELWFFNSSSKKYFAWHLVPSEIICEGTYIIFFV